MTRDEFPLSVRKAAWKAKPLPSKAMLDDFLEYCPETGRFQWVSPPRHYFPSDQAWLSWIGQCAGKPAVNTIRGRYFCGNLAGTRYYAHRLAWKIATGEDPHAIDHINGDGLDNRLPNLRSVSHSENSKNRRLRSDNKSGFTGVQWDARREKWRATVFSDGKRTHLGLFEDISDAVAARDRANTDLGFGPSHGAEK